MMLRIVAEVQGETLYTTLIDKVSEELEIPKSTVRWNLKGLRDSGLIAAGDRDNKGVPVRLTETGRVMTGVVSSVMGNCYSIRSRSRMANEYCA